MTHVQAGWVVIELGIIAGAAIVATIRSFLSH